MVPETSTAVGILSASYVDVASIAYAGTPCARTAPVTTITAREIPTARGTMAWLEAGAGWPLILLHAFPLNAAMWRPQLARVPDGWRFIAPHLRGFGTTPLGDQPPSMDTYAADVGALMDALSLDTAVIAGLSMGGYVAFAMYRAAPARLAGLVLADTRPQADTPDGRAGRAAMRELLARDGPRAVAAQMLPKLLSGGAGPALVELVRRMIESARPDGIDAAIVAMMARPDSTPDLGRISCATLVVAGDQDAITPPAEAQAMQAVISRSRLTLVEDGGHLANLEQPDAFSRILADFLLARL
jgi:pimeloyl-ACP methyl ester carboxylesterase